MRIALHIRSFPRKRESSLTEKVPDPPFFAGMTGVHRAASKHKSGVSRAQRSTKVMRCRPGTVPITAKQALIWSQTGSLWRTRGRLI